MMKTIFLSTMLSLGLIACSTPQKDSKQNTETSIQAPGSTSREPLSGVINQYMELKDAFVKSDSPKAKEIAGELASDLRTLKASSAESAAVEIASTTDLKIQRAAFQQLTNEVIALAKKGDLSTTVYVQYCPMAFENQGGQWLSLSKEILNPYFGEMMLHCGKVQEEI